MLLVVCNMISPLSSGKDTGLMLFSCNSAINYIKKTNYDVAINYLSRLINTKMQFSNGSQTYQISRKTAVRRHKMVALKIGIGFKYKLYHIFLMCDCWNSYRQLMHEHTWIQKMFACAKLAVKQTWCQWKYVHLFNTYFLYEIKK